MSLGVGVWLILLAVSMAVVAAGWSWRCGLMLRRMTPPTYATTSGRAGRPPFALLGLWISMAALLTTAPFLTSYTASASDGDDHQSVDVDGWGPAE